ncbi:hypothetical protein RBWH47_03033 [Rhodopirellula baltica WH47]|uniref:Uncharacterized protein n=1 Tax=Rhodopirellula baltica WH47 TaxID=991778 RepID=F2AP13_RHOBT|nr:hypothetical protein RBWH47_03033 [Rhodopirellula baltica WH47]
MNQNEFINRFAVSGPRTCLTLAAADAGEHEVKAIADFEDRRMG